MSLTASTPRTDWNEPAVCTPASERPHRPPGHGTGGRRLLAAVVFGLAAFSLAACGEDGPDLQAHFSENVPAGWQAKSFKIEVKEDVGSKVEPRRHYRFRAQVAPQEDLYRPVGRLDGTTVLKQAARQGAESEVLGTAVSVFQADRWESVFNFEQAPDFSAGKPASAHGAQYVVMGSADYRRAMTAARADLEQLAKQIEGDEAKLLEMIQEWNALNRKNQEESRVLAEALNAEQQRVQQAQMALREQASQDNRASDQQWQTELAQQSAPPRAEFDRQMAELDKDVRLKSAELQARRTELRQAQNTQQQALRQAYNTDLADARKRLDSPGFIRYRAEADEGLRTRRAALDGEFGKQQAALREQETALTSQRREQAGSYQAAYQEKISAIRQTLEAARNSRREAINQRVQAGMEALNAELQQKRQQQMEAVRAGSTQLAAQRRQTDQFSARIQESRRKGAQLHQALEALEREEG